MLIYNRCMPQSGYPLTGIDTAKRYSALSLLVFGVLADDPDTALAFDDLTFLADRFYGRSNLHTQHSFHKNSAFLFYHKTLMDASVFFTNNEVT